MALRRRFSFFVKVLLFVAICVSGSSVYSLYSQIYEQNDKTEPTIILVERGDSLNKIAQRLKNDGFIKSASVFKLAGRLSGEATHLKAGEYKIPAKASPKLILDILVSGQTVVRRLTIPEGLTSAQAVDLLMGTAALFGDIKEVPPNGTLLPETYVFSYGTPRRVVFERMRSAMNETIAELWPSRNPDLPYTTVEEALTLASIVERETSVPAERPRIAGVFVNRLKKGMRLQTDPTVIYAVTNGTMELNRRLTYADLKYDHPFNTYTRKGLPPAPICNPGRDSIAAVLNPTKTNELYFVADGSGAHAFARTFEEHRANIAAWKRNKRQKALAARQKRQEQAAQIAQTQTTEEQDSLETLMAQEAQLSLKETLMQSDEDASALPDEQALSADGDEIKTQPVASKEENAKKPPETLSEKRTTTKKYDKSAAPTKKKSVRK